MGSRGQWTPGGDPASVCLSPHEAHRSRSSDARDGEGGEPGRPGSQFQGPLRQGTPAGWCWGAAAGTARAFYSLFTESSTPLPPSTCRTLRWGPGRRALTSSHEPGQRCPCMFDDRTPVIRKPPAQPEGPPVGPNVQPHTVAMGRAGGESGDLGGTRNAPPHPAPGPGVRPPASQCTTRLCSLERKRPGLAGEVGRAR
ncbi:hypothetical protein PAL_GLEAN10005339 [Pteropus alecto]|uniref:Uncharacterized protein n=1 Tax=Pteropus alecto TaxID=9402 RepID=L5JTS2_PTEAL|nr:hypothetical protein PAL_GLEAN10005339 [Pteropus alecto]